MPKLSPESGGQHAPVYARIMFLKVTSNFTDFQRYTSTINMSSDELFGDKKNLLNFLNIIFQGRKDIVDLTYCNTERVGRGQEDGTVIFDLIVETTTGEKVIVEMQTSSHKSFKKRMLYYGCNVVSEKAPRGNRASFLSLVKLL